MREVTLGVVPYLNALPLIEGLGDLPWVRMVRAVPSRLSEMLAGGEIDAATLPIIDAAADPGYRVIPGISISSMGPAGSVRIFHRSDLGRVKTVHLDPASRTSCVLVRILLEKRLGLRPSYVSAGEAPDGAEAILRIGDASLFAEDGRYDSIDVGDLWTAWTGLPFVYAAWVGRGEIPGLADALTEAKIRGQAAIRRISEEAAARTGKELERIESYLRRMMRYDLGGPEREAIDLYYRYAIEIGALPPHGALRFALPGRSATDRARPPAQPNEETAT